jgi:hypothetical protein
MIALSYVESAEIQPEHHVIFLLNFSTSCAGRFPVGQVALDEKWG